MATGRVRAYRPLAGFGFITPSHNCGNVFVQADDIDDAEHNLVAGEVVEYEPEVGIDGQLKAVHVHVVDRSDAVADGASPAAPRPGWTP